MAVLDDDLFLVNRAGTSYQCQASLLRDKLVAGDFLFVNSADFSGSFKVEGDRVLASNYPDDVWFLVNRASVSYRVSGQTLKEYLDVGGGGAVPIGLMGYFPSSALPVGWYACDGRTLPAATYPELFAVIGTTYGGDIVNFALPNMLNAVLYQNGNVNDTIPESINKSLLSANVSGISFSTNTEDAAGGWSFSSENTGQHTHDTSKPANNRYAAYGRQEFLDAQKRHHYQDRDWHRDRGSANTNYFSGMRNDNHSHSVKSMTLADESHDHGDWKDVSINTNHNHDSINRSGRSVSLPGSTEFKVYSMTMVPCIYGGR